MKRYINLLPPEEQKQIILERYNSQIAVFGLWVILSLTSMIGIIFLAEIIFSYTLTSGKEEIAAQNLELTRVQDPSIMKRVEELNRDIQNFQTFQKQDLDFSPYLAELQKILPIGLTLDSITLKRENKRIEVTGRAANRAQVLVFRNYIIDSEYFENVNFPLYNLESPENVKWKYRFYLKTSKDKQ